MQLLLDPTPIFSVYARRKALCTVFDLTLRPVMQNILESRNCDCSRIYKDLEIVILV